MTSVTTGMSSSSPTRAEDLEAVFAQALEAVGAGARLERPAAEDVGAGVSDALGDLDQDLFAFDGAGAGDHARWPPPTFTPRPTSTTESSAWNSRLASLNGLRIGTTCSTPGIAWSGSVAKLVLVADDADDGPLDAPADLVLEAHFLHFLADVLELGLGAIGLQDDDHSRTLRVAAA